MPQTDTMEDNTKFKDGVNRNARLIVRNISFKATEEALREHFKPYGNVEEVKLLKRPDGKLVGCGFVHYTHVQMANKALTATNRKPFLGRPINVAWAVAKDKYTEKLNENPLKKRKSSGSGVLADDDEPEVTEVKKDSPNKKGPKEDDKKKERLNRNARLVVRNVSFKATEDSLKEHFQSYGDIIEVKLLKKPDGKLVGCAFVHFKNVPMAKKALLNTNMKPFLGRPISVDWAVAKDKYMQYVVGKQLELQNDVKKEDSDDDEDGHQPLNISNDDFKAEIKSESEDGSGKEDVKSEDEDSDASAASDDDDDDQDSDGDEDEEEDDEPNEDDIDMEDDDKSETESTVPERKRIKLNDAEDGCTVFLTNIPFSVDNEQLQQFAEKTGSVRYALVCIDKLTEHSKGSGFIKFMTKDEADKFLSLPPSSLRLDAQVMVAKPALQRESLQSPGSKQPKDNRNLYLVKEGVVVAGTKAALGLSASDMAKRLVLEKSKTQMLKNLNRFVSRYRLVVSNLPPTCTDATLRATCARAAGRAANVTEARVMRDLRAPPQRDGKHPTKGYGFVMFTRHEDALQCLRKLNNNPDIFDPKNRPIVSFSIEDRTALNARKKRLEKSIVNNPQQNNAAENTEEDSNNKGYRKRKGMEKPDESKFKRGKFDRNDNRGNRQDGGNQGDRNQQNGRWNKQGGNQNDGNQQNGRWNKQGGNQNDGNQQNGRWNKQDGGNQNDGNQDGGRNRKGGNQKNGWKQNNPGMFVRPNNDDELGDYTGITAREGSKHNMRSNQKLKAQADLHKQSVKAEKKTSQRAMRLKMAAKERVKQPKQKVNKNPKKGNYSIIERKVNAAIKESSTFNDLVSKYKSKLAGNSLDRVKAKWYEA